MNVKHVSIKRNDIKSQDCKGVMLCCVATYKTTHTPVL